MNISEEVLKELLSIIKRRMTPHPVKIRARKFNGIDACASIVYLYSI
jgi:translation initiation factor 2 alpha subunit (eIF-2alpha)